MCMPFYVLSTGYVDHWIPISFQSVNFRELNSKQLDISQNEKKKERREEKIKVCTKFESERIHQCAPLFVSNSRTTRVKCGGEKARVNWTKKTFSVKRIPVGRPYEYKIGFFFSIFGSRNKSHTDISWHNRPPVCIVDIVNDILCVRIQ